MLKAFRAEMLYGAAIGAGISASLFNFLVGNIAIGSVALAVTIGMGIYLEARAESRLARMHLGMVFMWVGREPFEEWVTTENFIQVMDKECQSMKLPFGGAEYMRRLNDDTLLPPEVLPYVPLILPMGLLRMVPSKMQKDWLWRERDATN